MSNLLTYTRRGDYYIRDLCLTDSNTMPFGKYGRMRKTYLREHRPVLWNTMVLSETLFPHLREIDKTANRRIEQIMSDMLAIAPAPDKETQQMAWVQHMNMLKAQAEEIICEELIYS